MHFAIRCQDAPGSGALRAQTLPAHAAYMKSAAVGIVLAGPLLAVTDQSPLGSLIVIEADSEMQAHAFIAAAPMQKAGVWHQITLEQFVPVSRA